MTDAKIHKTFKEHRIEEVYCVLIDVLKQFCRKFAINFNQDAVFYMDDKEAQYRWRLVRGRLAGWQNSRFAIHVAREGGEWKPEWIVFQRCCEDISLESEQLLESEIYSIAVGNQGEYVFVPTLAKGGNGNGF